MAQVIQIFIFQFDKLIKNSNQLDYLWYNNLLSASIMPHPYSL